MKPLHRSQCKKMMAGRRTISRETYFTRSEYPSMYWSILYFEMFIRGRGWWPTAQQPCSHIWLRFQSFTLKIVLSWLLKSKLRLSRTDGRISQARFWDKMRPSLEPLWLHILYICSLVGVWIGFESHKNMAHEEEGHHERILLSKLFFNSSTKGSSFKASTKSLWCRSVAKTPMPFWKLAFVIKLLFPKSLSTRHCNALTSFETFPPSPPLLCCSLSLLQSEWLTGPNRKMKV